MENYGYIRVAAAMPEVHVADTEANAKEAVSLVNTIWKEKEASIIVFPELSVTGYTCADLFGRPGLSERAEDAVASIVARTAGLPVLLALGAPVPYAGRLFNCAIIARGGKILGIVPKTYLPGNDEFYEPRWFESARILGKELIMMDYASQRVPFGTAQLFVLGGIELGVELCQDLWVPVPPCTAAALAGAKIILNLSASNEVLMKQQYRRQLVGTTAAKLHAGYVYCSSGYGESTQDLVWTGSSMIYESGTRLAENERFQTSSCYIAADIDTERLTSGRLKDASYRCEEMMIPHYQRVDAGSLPVHRFKGGLMHHVEPHPFVPDIAAEDYDLRCREIIDIQVAGLRTRLDHIGCRSAVIGVSGGLDSTLALLVTALAFDSLGLPRTGITGITMPGLGTTRRTHDNSLELMRLLGISSSEIGQDESVHDVTYENSQARERTQVLMDVANKLGGIVIGTGDLSELALGWCTYNGDHMSMYAVNSSIPKTLVRTLVVWASRNRFGDEVRDVLLDIADTPISPELTPADSEGRIAQKTEDLVGPYELHDFFLFQCMRYGFGKEKILFLAKQAFSGIYSDETIERWLDVFMRRFVRQQFKRSCLPDGPKVGSVALSPRGDWRMPTDLEVDQF